LFKTELVEKLRQVVSNGDIGWLDREKNKIDQWTEERFEFDLDNSVDGYQDRYFNALFECAKKIITPDDDFSDTLRLIEAKTGFSAGFVADCCNLLKANKLYSTVEMIEIPILLVEPRRNRAGLKTQPGDNGFAAYLCLEKVNLEVCSKPYPHPDNMFCTFVDRQVERAINDAFSFLLQKKGEKEVPVFRWWVKPIKRELVAIEGPSLYGAFVVGMYALTHDLSIPKNMTVTCDGDFSGHLSGIKGLKEKLDAAADEKLKTVVVCKGQDQRELTGEQKTQKKLLKKVKEAKNADELLRHFCPRERLIKGFIRGIGYFVIAFLVVVAVGGVFYLKQEHASLEQEHASLKQEHASLEQEHASLKEEHDSLKQEHASLEQEHASLKEEHDSLKQEHDPLKQEHDSLEKERDSLEKERDSLKQEHASLLDFLKKESKELDGRNKVLDSNLSRALTTLRNKEYETASLAEKLDLVLMCIRAHEQDSAIIYTENPKFVRDDKFATTLTNAKTLLNERRISAGNNKIQKILGNKFSECSVPPRNWY
jgi:FtsZ-binding cell division protein ZapB